MGLRSASRRWRTISRIARRAPGGSEGGNFELAPPVLFNTVYPPSSFFVGWRPRVILTPDSFGERTVKDQSVCSFRIGRGEERGHRTGLAHSKDCRSLEADCFHHRENVIHPLFEVG